MAIGVHEALDKFKRGVPYIGFERIDMLAETLRVIINHRKADGAIRFVAARIWADFDTHLDEATGMAEEILRLLNEEKEG